MSSFLEWLGFDKGKKPKPSPSKKPKKKAAKPPTPPKKPKKRAGRSTDDKNLAKAHDWQKKQKQLKKVGKPHKKVGRPKGSRARAKIGRHTCGLAYVDAKVVIVELDDHLEGVNPDVFRDGASPTDRTTANTLYTDLAKALDQLQTACGCIADPKGKCSFSVEKTYGGFRELLPQLQSALQKKDAIEALRVTRELDTQFDWLMESARKG